MKRLHKIQDRERISSSFQSFLKKPLPILAIFLSFSAQAARILMVPKVKPRLLKPLLTLIIPSVEQDWSRLQI